MKPSRNKKSFLLLLALVAIIVTSCEDLLNRNSSKVNSGKMKMM